MIYGQAESAIPSPEPLGRLACERRGRLPETASCIRKEASRQPILKPSNGTNVLQIGHCAKAAVTPAWLEKCASGVERQVSRYCRELRIFANSWGGLNGFGT